MAWVSDQIIELADYQHNNVHRIVQN